MVKFLAGAFLVFMVFYTIYEFGKWNGYHSGHRDGISDRYNPPTGLDD